MPTLVRALIRIWEKQATAVGFPTISACMHVWDSPYEYTGCPYAYMGEILIWDGT